MQTVHTKTGIQVFLNNNNLHPREHSVKKRKEKYVYNVFVAKSTNAAGLETEDEKNTTNSSCLASGEREDRDFAYFSPQLKLCMFLKVRLRMKKRMYTSALTRAKFFGWNCLCTVYGGLSVLYHRRCSTSFSESTQLQVIEAHCTCSPQAHVHVRLIGEQNMGL